MPSWLMPLQHVNLCPLAQCHLVVFARVYSVPYKGALFISLEGRNICLKLSSAGHSKKDDCQQCSKDVCTAGRLVCCGLIVLN